MKKDHLKCIMWHVEPIQKHGMHLAEISGKMLRKKSPQFLLPIGFVSIHVHVESSMPGSWSEGEVSYAVTNLSSY